MRNERCQKISVLARLESPILQHALVKWKAQRATLSPRLKATLLFYFIALSFSLAQQGIVLQNNFKFAPGGYYPPPHQKQLKSLLTGLSAEERASGVYFVKEARFETFLENSQREMLVQAPSCLYDNKGDHSISSPGPLDFQAADGKFSIAGQGFHWSQTNSSLFISNDIHTIVHPELLQTQNSTSKTNKAPVAAKGINILSDRFDYFGESGIGNYRDNVRVSGTDLEMSAAQLQFVMPMKQKTLQRMTADENVHLVSGELRASGQHVDYTPSTGLIRVQGEPKWQAEQREGQADELLIDRSNRIFRAVGHSRLQISGQNTNAPGFLPGISGSASNQIVEVLSDSYEIRTNSAEFISQVHVAEKLGDESRAKMTCDHMVVTFSGTNQMDHLLAEENVVIEQASKKFTAHKAFFTATNQLLNLTGEPAWYDGLRSGRGDTIGLNGLKNEMIVRSNAWLELPAGTISPTSSLSTAATDSLLTTNRVAQISCPEYSLGTNESIFQGGVLVSHPQMQLNCETLTMQAPDSSARAQTLVAQQDVNFDLINENGQKIHGTGQRVVYQYSVVSGKTNDFVELTGDPKLTMTNGSTFQNKVIMFDRISGKVIAPGKYFIRSLGTSNPTNNIPSPKTERRRKA
jgi:lipopolysaccharide export system protein LptA